MSVLSDKYNIPAETVNKMIKDGIISCSWTTYDEVHRLFSEGKSTADIAHLTHVAQRTVQFILKNKK
jgi:DNA-binding NarL/FixJ family response regulator